MGRELGRISGPLLAENLLRNGNNLAFETNLLYLDVVNGWVGIKNATPTRTLNITGKTDTTNLIVDTGATVASLEFTTSQIQNVSGSVTLSPNQSLNPTVNVPRLTTASLDITTNRISNTTLNSNITLDPMGTGQLVVTTTNVDIRGSLHATGNITWDGSVVFGDNDTDNVTFNADINSSIIPDVHNLSNLGSVAKEWRNLYSHNIAGNVVVGSSLTVNSINVLQTQGQTIYVSVNGNDSRTGTHLHDPYLTVKKALSVAVAGDKIVIFPGIYTEIFPLTVPQGVGVCGTNLRSVVIKPTDATKFKDAFLLNGETTVENLTVGNFYYDAVLNTGYGFRLASNCLVTTRSPYVQNVTVLTNTSSIDFQTIIDGEYSTSAIVAVLNGGDNAGVFADITDGNPTAVNAGCGALVDGSVVNSSSKEATILFSTVTIIAPGADGVTATNGARVEWLNSFTYFAYRGIYLTQGLLGFASQGVRFGAELRSINSANIYGTYGAVADGVNTAGYLIGHNFSYVGSVLDSQNNNALVTQANETVELNSGRIYYDSADQNGNYRIGDIFLANQSTGNLSFNSQSITYTGNSSITLDTGGGRRTFVSAAGFEVGNIRINTNNISSATGPVIFSAYNGSTYLNTNVTVAGSTDVTGDTNVKGSVTLGNETTDTITIYDQLTQSVNPKTTNTYTLGKITGTAKIWNTLYTNLVNVDAVTQLSNNTITTLTTNTDLQLATAGVGIISVVTTDVDVTNNLTVVGSSNLQAVGIVGDLILPSAYTYSLTGSNARTGNTGITGTLTVNPVGLTHPVVQFQNINITDNDITTTVTNSNLVLTTAATNDIIDGGPYNITIDSTVEGGNSSVVNLQTINGGFTNLSYDNIVNVINTDVQVDNGLTVKLTLNANSFQTAGNVTAVDFNVGSLYIKDNISVVPTNTNLILKAYTGKNVHLLTSDVNIPLNLSVAGPFTADGNSSLKAVTVVGAVAQTGNITQTGSTAVTGTFGATGNITVSGSSSFLTVNNVKLDTNIISATVTNANLEFRANGTGGVLLERYLKFANNTISNIFDSNNIDLAFNNLMLAEDSQSLIVENGDFLLADTLLDSDFSIKFVPNGVGNLVIDSNKAFAVAYGNNANRLLTDPGEIRQNSTTKVYEGKSGAGNVSFTGIYDTDGNTYITPELTPGANDNILRFGINGSVKATVSSTALYSNTVYVDNISINNTDISNLDLSTDLELIPNGTGVVNINSVYFKNNTITNTTNGALIFANTDNGYVRFGGNAVLFPVGDSANRGPVYETGETRFNTALQYLEVYDGTIWGPASGTAAYATLDEIQAELDLWSLILG